MKKYLSVLLALVLMLCLSACGGDSNGDKTEESKGEQESSATLTTTVPTTAPTSIADVYEWQEISGGIEITKYLGSDTKIVIPSVIENKAVVSVGTTFSGNIVLEELELPDTVTKADLSNCKALKRLTAHGPMVMSAKKLNLSGCTALEYLSLANNGGRDFDAEGLTSLREVVLNGEGMVSLAETFGETETSDELKLLDTVDISRATAIYYAEYFSEEYPVDVIINSEINKCYVVAEYDYDKEKYVDYYYCMYVDGKYDGKQDDGKEITITDENRAKIYCEVFRCKKVTINGVEYECDSVVDNFRG